MEASNLTIDAAAARLKREDVKRTEDDHHFSDWKTLVGPSDWEDYSAGKEGAERYRVHNLPKKESPGVYELGIAVLHTGLGREIGKLDPDCIVPVYLGQADNVRTRLQQYGRSGAHLGNGCSNCPNPSECIPKGADVIEEIFSRGHPIVYRWAPKENKSAALETEAQRLRTYDYAWNTNNNGARRPHDVFQKLKKNSSSTMRFANIAQKLPPSRRKNVGIQIESSRLPSPEEKFSAYADREGHNLDSQVFKFGRSQPRLVLDISEITQENTKIGGVAVGDGTICQTPPVPRREMCGEHKGMWIKGSTSVGISNSNVVSESSGSSNRAIDSLDSVCGFILASGSRCMRHPPHGRVRCDEHKGMRIKDPYSNVVSQSSGSSSNRGFDSYGSVCGFILTNGSPCMKHPPQGRVRCNQHKGRRI